MKHKFLALIPLLMGCCLTSCKTFMDYPNFVKESHFKEISHCGDSLWCNGIAVTNISEKLVFYNDDFTPIKEFDITSVWQDVIYLNENYYLICGNYQNEMNYYRFDNGLNVIESKTLFTAETLMIDPTIYYFENYFYITYTQIVGNVNNKDTTKETGTYTIKCYKTTDFNDVEFVCDIDSRNKNLEDVQIFEYNGKLAAIYEIEDYHQQPSKVCLRYSINSLFDTEKILLTGSDLEPATLMNYGNEFYFFYASDKDNPGMSYDGLEVFLDVYDSSFNLKETRKIPTKKTPNKLYNVCKIGTTWKFISSINYNTTRDLYIELFA